MPRRKGIEYFCGKSVFSITYNLVDLERIFNTFNAMTHQLKIKLFVFTCFVLIGFCLPLIIKIVFIKRVFQFIILSITSFLMLSFIQEKIKNKQSINYIGIILVTLYGIGLFFIASKIIAAPNIFFSDKNVCKLLLNKKAPTK